MHLFVDRHKEDGEGKMRKMIKASINLTIYIPEDILILIFLNLPIKTLFRCKLVCKAWFIVIHSPCFSYMYLNKVPSQTFPLAISCILSYYNFYILEEEVCSTSSSKNINGVWRKKQIPTSKPMLPIFSSFEIVGSCNGLICLKDGDTLNIINPFYSKVIKKVPLPEPLLQDPHEGMYKFSYGFGFDESTQVFKIVVPFGLGFFCCDLVSSSSSSSQVCWRELSPMIKYPYPSTVQFCDRPGVFIDGALYFLIQKLGNREMEILCFHLKNKSLDMIPLPFLNDALMDCYCSDLFDFHGNLGMAKIIQPGYIGVWRLMKIEDKNEWIEKLHMKLRESRGFNLRVGGFVAPCSILMKIDEICYIGDLQTGLLKPIHYLGCTLLLAHRGSFIHTF